MPLNRSDVLVAALSLLDSEGLDGLTMRRLASSLHVQAGALYWHFADKQALLDAMAEQLFVELGEPVGDDQPWRERVAALARQVRATLLSHRDGARLLAGTYVAQPHTMRTGTAFIRAFLAAGLSSEQAGLTVFALLYYILGHTIEEQARDELIAAGQWQQRLEELDDENFPEVARAVRSLDTISADARFEHGLQLFLDGVPAN